MRFKTPILALVGVLALAGVVLAQATSNYREQGGSRTVIGGSIDVISGGDLDIESGGVFSIAGITVSSSAAELNQLDGTTSSAELTRLSLGSALHQPIRFCGQGPNGATTTYISPDTHDGNGSLLASTHCDGEDSTTEATADEVMFSTAVVVGGMVCEITDGGTDDTLTFALRSAAGAVTGMTCNVTLDGSGTETCTVTPTAQTIAAGATMAVSMVATDDDCSACDALCTVFGAM